MRLARDKRLHVIGTVIACAGIVGLHHLAAWLGLWAAVGAGGTALAWAWEWLQKVRGEGEPSVEDALVGTITAWVFAGILLAAEAA